MSDKDLISDIKELVSLNVSYSNKPIVDCYCFKIFNEIRSCQNFEESTINSQ